MNLVKVDFKMGATIYVGYGSAPVHYRMINEDTGACEHEGIITGPMPPLAENKCISLKKYYINWTITLDRGTEHEVVRINLKNKPVLIAAYGMALGDILSSMSAVDEFQCKHKCKLYLYIKDAYADILRSMYRNIIFVNSKDLANRNMYDFYAVYGLSVFVQCPIGEVYNKVDARKVPLWSFARFNLGVPIKEVPAKIAGNPQKKDPKLIAICPGASQVCKMWNYPNGWQTVIDYLTEKGYKIVCLDNKPTTLKNVTDDTGDKPLLERAEVLRKSTLSICTPSGLAWLSWSVGTPVCMISGYSDHGSEMECYEVRATSECHGCWNTFDITESPETFQKHKSCPYHVGTVRQHECWHSITPERVTAEVDRALKEIEK